MSIFADLWSVIRHCLRLWVCQSCIDVGSVKDGLVINTKQSLLKYFPAIMGSGFVISLPGSGEAARVIGLENCCFYFFCDVHLHRSHKTKDIGPLFRGYTKVQELIYGR